MAVFYFLTFQSCFSLIQFSYIWDLIKTNITETICIHYLQFLNPQISIMRIQKRIKAFLFQITLIFILTPASSQDISSSKSRRTFDPSKIILKVGIVEPFIQKNIPVIKRLILEPIKERLENKYIFSLIKNDSLLNVNEIPNQENLKMLFSQNNQFDAYIIIKHFFVEARYYDINAPLLPFDINSESNIQMWLYDRNGKLICSYQENPKKVLKLYSSQKSFKKMQRTSKRVINELIVKSQISI